MNDFDFASKFEIITAEDGEGYSPFSWQKRLFSELCNGVVPDALDLPTGIGKTSVIALWLLARVTGAPLPRRLIYVVDRRTVVDQATRYAESLRKNLIGEPGLSTALGLDGPLPISTLRGQFADNREWLADPAGPSIVIGTVDMIGSRLLFQGYGVSPWMRPMQAGLLAMDSLLVLDEAHLSQPFLRMARTVADMSEEDGLKVMSLSATLGKASGVVFGLNEEDRSEAIVAQRLGATKSLRLEEQFAATPSSFAQFAWELGAANPDARILVFRDSFDDAVAIATALQKLAKKGGGQVGLLTGQRRGHEREQLESWLKAHGFLAGSQAERTVPVFLIATSAGEVGIDLDADHMLCDLVTWDRMVQRLGRVNRRGENGGTTITVWDLGEMRDEADLARRHLTRKLLAPPPGDTILQAGPSALAQISCRPEAQDASTPEPLYPELQRPHVDAWAMTSLSDHAGRPEVGPWLRGWEEGHVPQTRLVWRQYLPVHHRGGSPKPEVIHLREYLDVAPLRPSEQLETRSDRVLVWMKKRGKRLARLRTQPGHCLPPARDLAALFLNADGSLAGEISFAAWEEGDPRGWRRIERLLPGRTLLLRREVAGLDGDRTENNKPVSGLGFLNDRIDALPLTGDKEGTFNDIHVTFREVNPEADAERLKLFDDSGPAGLLRIFVTKTDGAGAEKEGFAVIRHLFGGSEDEEGRSVRTVPQTINAHTADVVALVSEFTRKLGLDKDTSQALIQAAEHHDIGKAVRLWQDAAGASGSFAMAKTTGRGARWNLLQGYRHEFGSLVALEKRTDLPSKTRDLTLHLVAAHHGRARPLIAPDSCEEGPPAQMVEVAGRAALRFASLNAEYGPWRLAWLEAILRAADQQASAKAGRGAGHG